MIRSSRHFLFLFAGLLPFVLTSSASAHDHSAEKAERRRQESIRRALAQAETPKQLANQPKCQLTIELIDSSTGKPLPGLLRITRLRTTGEPGGVSPRTTGLNGEQTPISLASEILRERNWYSVKSQLSIPVPQAKLRIEALHGLETERLAHEVDLTGKQQQTMSLKLNRIYDPRAKDLQSGNTHLHLMKMSYLEALNYLRVVPQSDGLDLVFLSHLRRIPDERDYISNQIVENSFQGGDLQRLSQQGVVYGNGQEHRHNFGRGGEGFGHVMLLDLQKLIHPVSIGPGIMGEGTDGRPLQQGIQEARRDGATAIWCHNTFGFEDLPNWAAGLLHAQNIFDGGEHGSYRDTYYRYLNLGWQVPFSTGTDWFIYDFSRVYVPITGMLTSNRWLAQLQKGRSYITNGPFLEFTVDGHPVGDTLELDKPTSVLVRGRAVGRIDFRGLELIHNGDVIRETKSKAEAGHFVADFELPLTVDQPGWLALRIPLDAGKNDFDKPLFAHTSAIYFQFAGRRIFRPEIAQQLIAEMEQNLTVIREQAKFAAANEREAVEKVYRDGITQLRTQIQTYQSTRRAGGR